MHGKRIRSIQRTFILTSFSILFITFFIFTLVFTTTQVHRINEESVTLLTQKINNISSFIESDTEKLNTLAQNIAYSDLIKTHFIEYFEATDSTSPSNVTEYNEVQNTKILIDLLTAMIGPTYPASQIYLYSFTEGTFGVGLDTSVSDTHVTNMPWFEQLNSSKNKRLYYWGSDSRLTPYFSYSDGDICLSLCTMYYNRYNSPIGIIEVKMPVTKLVNQIELLSNIYHEDVYIYDGTGTCVYSSGEPTDIFYEYLTNEEFHSNETSHTTYQNKYELFYKTSSANNFTTLVAVKNTQLYRPIFDYIIKIIILFMAVLCLALLFSYTVAHSITTPISEIHTKIRAFRLETTAHPAGTPFPAINTGILEFNTLYDALIEMQHQIQISMQNEITLQNQEMQSRMLALQAQMNPHFLYNALATIQSMAEENMNKELIQMCQTISQMLRYISSGKEMLVPLKAEIKYVENYLKCIKIRYEDDFQYHISIPDEMQDLEIPKLCLQPLVENSVKYSTKSVHAPWEITVSGFCSDTHWEIQVVDNGPGFSQTFLHDFEKKILEIDNAKNLPALEINGMGLLNIYIRIKLFYKDHHIFRLENLPTGGALVIIGGTLYE